MQERRRRREPFTEKELDAMEHQWKEEERMKDVLVKEMDLMMLGQIMATLGKDARALMDNPEYCKLIVDYTKCFEDKNDTIKQKEAKS